MKFFYKLRWFFYQEWKKYLGTCILLIIVTILQLIPSQIIGNIIDSSLKDSLNKKDTMILISSIIIISLIIYVLRYFWRMLLFGTSYKLATTLRMKFFQELMKKKSNFYNKNNSGNLMALATNDIDRVVFAAGEGVLTLLDSIILGISIFITMCIQIDWRLSIVSLFPFPIMIILLKKYSKKLHNSYIESQKNFSELNSQTKDSLQNIRMIHEFGLEKLELKKFIKVSQDASEKNRKIIKIDSKFDPIIHLSIALSNLLSVIGGTFLISKNYISFGQLTSFILYLGNIVWPMLAFSWMFNIFEKGNVAWERIQKILKNEKNVKKIEKNENISKLSKLSIQIKNFKYFDSKKTILKNIDLSISSGEIIGISGPNGSGKSTLLKIIQKNYSIQEGKIEFNQENIKNIDDITWRKKISIVNQAPFLFSGTILYNIAFGNPKASFSDIQNAAKIAHIEEEIKKFKLGYSTYIGESGSTVSGGQKQRLSIARAFLPQKEILILDDPFSSVDPRTEKKILNNIFKSKKKDQVIIITSHKLSNFKNANKIIILKQGEIIEQGNHNQLIQKKGWYYKNYN